MNINAKPMHTIEVKVYHNATFHEAPFRGPLILVVVQVENVRITGPVIDTVAGVYKMGKLGI